MNDRSPNPHARAALAPSQPTSTFPADTSNVLPEVSNWQNTLKSAILPTLNVKAPVTAPRMKFNSLIVAFTLAAQLAQAQLTLKTCQEKARANYPLIKQYELIDKAEEYTLSNAGKGYLPQFSANLIGGYVIKGLPSLVPAVEESKDKVQFIGIGQINQALWDGGATRAQKQIVRVGSDVDQANIDVAFHDLEKRVSQLFFSVLLFDEQLKLSSLLIDNLNINLKAVVLSNENGLAFSSDVDEVKAEVLKADQRVLDLTHARQGFALMLALMIGEPGNSNLQLAKPIVSDLSPEGLPAEVGNRPELNLYTQQHTLADAQLAMQKVANMPKIGLLGAGILIQPGFAFGPEKIQSLAIAGLSASWNTRGVYQSSNNVQLTQIQHDRINSQKETFMFNTKLQMTQQSSDIEKQKSILAKDREIVTLRSSIKKAYEVKYKNGVSTMNDLLRVTNSENEAMANEAIHQIQLLMSLSDYQNTSGN
jgi:outer membrane protein TolC